MYADVNHLFAASEAVITLVLNYSIAFVHVTIINFNCIEHNGSNNGSQFSKVLNVNC